MKPAVFWVAVLAAAASIHYYVFVPIQELAALNLMAWAEPFFLTRLVFYVVSTLVVVGGRYYYFPIVLYAAYRLARRLAPVAGTAAVERLRWRKRRARGRAARVLRAGAKVLGVTYLAACAALLVPQVAVSAVFAARVAAHPRGAAAYYRLCGACHSRVHPLNFNQGREQWGATLDRKEVITGVAGRALSASDKGALLDFLAAVRGYSDGRLIWSKCHRCHPPHEVFRRRRTAQEWRLAIDRVRKVRPFFVSEAQAAQIADAFARDPRRAVEPPTGAEAATWAKKITFERKCSLCHTLDVVVRYRPADDQWETVLRRMGGKASDVLSVEEALDLREYLRSLPADEARFAPMFPHSKMRETASD